MPLALCTAFFIILFSLEFFLYDAKVDEARRQLRRYHQVEHPRHRRSDDYLDADMF